MLEGLAAQVRAMPLWGFLALAAALVAALLFAFFRLWRDVHRARVIEDTPTARLRSAAQGFVELEGAGSLLDGPPIVAPLTGSRCLWYRYRVERRDSQMDSRGHSHDTWSTIHSGISDDLFSLDDGTGACVVDPEGAEVIPAVRQVWYGDDEWPRVGPLAGSLRIGPVGFGRYRYVEERLMPGTLYAMGWFRTLSNADASLGDETGALLRQWKLDQPTLLKRFDVNGDGRIDAGEWEQARRAARRQVLEERRREPAAAATNTLTRPADDRHPFILSALPQAQLTRRYRLRAGLALAGVAASLAALLWVLVVRLG